MSGLIAQKHVGNGVIRVLQGDITLAHTDGIVNAANSRLQHGGGVAAAIVRRGGPSIQEESDAAGFVPEGNVAVTGAGDLQARYIIHAVGPRGSDPEGDRKLQMATTNALLAAQELGLTSLSLPAISSGIFGFPKDRCASILIAAASDYLRGHLESPLRQIDFVLFDDETRDHFAGALREQTSA